MKEYDVYIGNLSILTTEKQLEKLFSQFGTVKNVTIQQGHLKFTFGFVGFSDLLDAERACKELNGVNVNGNILKVKISENTKEKLRHEQSVVRQRSFLRKPTKIKELNNILKNQLIRASQSDSSFMTSFTNAIKQMDEMEKDDFNKCHPFIIHPFKKPNRNDLEETILRFYGKPKEKTVLFKDVDFDLTKKEVDCKKLFEYEF